jgi:hypothetical protein
MALRALFNSGELFISSILFKSGDLASACEYPGIDMEIDLIKAELANVATKGLFNGLNLWSSNGIGLFKSRFA